MNDANQDILTLGAFETGMKRIDGRFMAFESRMEKLDKRMMDGFSAIFDRFDGLEIRMDRAEKGIKELGAKFDRLEVTKADRKELLSLDDRVLSLEEKSA
ncbi:MAG: hypothetical protein Q8L64_04885 [bacterium]|nr:hypothetical protein [bacterium]